MKSYVIREKRGGGSTRFAMASGMCLLVVLLVGGVEWAWSHCDTISGPVVSDAMKALAAKDVTPVLKWVKPDDEPEIRRIFELTLKVRGGSTEGREVADQYFFETLVRIHRAGEGEPFTGLKSAEAIDQGIEMADKAIETGIIQPTSSELSEALAKKIGRLYSVTVEASKHKDESVESGRAFVQAYVEYIHFVESAHKLVSDEATTDVEAGATGHHH